MSNWVLTMEQSKRFNSNEFQWIHCVSLRLAIDDRRNVMVSNNGQIIDSHIAYRSTTSLAINFISFRILTNLCVSFEVLQRFVDTLFWLFILFAGFFLSICFCTVSFAWLNSPFIVALFPSRIVVSHHCIAIIYEAKRLPIYTDSTGW